MKILYDHEFFSTFKYSGISRYFFELLTRLASDHGFDVELFMGFQSNAFGFGRNKEIFRRFFGPRRPVIPKTTRLFNELNERLFPIWAALSTQDVFHQTYCRYRIPRFKGRRAMTLYDLTYEVMPHLFPKHDLADQKALSARHAHGIIAISESTRRDGIERLGLNPNKVKTIYLGSSLPRLEGDIPKPFDFPYLLYVGQRVAHKNFGLIAEALTRLKGSARDAHLVCFGGTQFTPAEAEALKKAGWENRIHWLTGDDDVLIRLYRHALALVYPSFYEGFGLPVLEAMSQGCPVLISNSSSLPEVGGMAARYFDPRSSEEFATQLQTVLDSEEVRRTMSESGHQQSLKFSWDRCAAETAAFYRDL